MHMPRPAPMQNIPQVSIKTIELSKFKGVDLSSSVTNVDIKRSPSAPNMMPSDDGFPVKRKGYHTVLTNLSGAVHAAYSLTAGGAVHELIHAGTVLYKVERSKNGEQTTAVLYTGMANAPSCAVQLGGKLWILDGKTYLVYDAKTIRPVSEVATIPKITIAKAPNGKNGATSYKPANFLTGKRTDSYLGIVDEKVYFLSFNALKATAVSARKMDANGNWQKMSEGADFSVDRTLGKVSFTAAPGKSAVEGEDNVQITYEVAGKEATINACRFCFLYGVNGALDRVFAAGSPKEPNVDYWSEFNDPAYFGDMWYGILGQEASPIMGYSVIGDSLVTHKAGEENGRNAFVRKGELDKDGFAVFKITNVMQGDGAVARRSFANVNSEPLFLTARGVYALTPSDMTGERYTQNRSWYINGALTQANLASASAVVWGRFYALAVPGEKRIYLLDAEQKTYAEKAPQASFQYEGYYFTDIGAECLWTRGKVLCFGTADGRVCELHTADTASSYLDDDKPIKAHWTTPLMNLGTWANLKTVTSVWVVGKPSTRSGGDVYYITNRDYERLGRSYNIDIFDWGDIDFDRFTFNTLDGPVVVPIRKKAKKIQLFQLKIANEREREAFGVLAMQINFKTGGKVKK